MEKLEIHESLIPLIQKYTGKKELNPSLIEDNNLIRKVNAAYRDCYKYLPLISMFNFISYNIIREFYSIPPVDSKTRDKYLKMVLDDKDVRNKIINSNPESEFFSVIKDIIPYYNELQEYINSNNNYMTIMQYKEIVDFLDSEALKNYKDDKLEEECHKRFNYPNNTKDAYNFRMKNKKYQTKQFEVGNIVTKGFYSSTCLLLSNYFHELMINFYKKTGYYYSPINEDLDYYVIGNMPIVGYKHDDNITMSINNYKWNRYEFWALLNMNELPNIKIDSSDIRRILKDDNNILIAPNDFIEEALIKHIMSETGERTFTNNILKILQKIGIPEDFYRSDVLTSYKNNTYYINPKKYEYLKIKEIMKIPTLELILVKNEDNRDKYIKKLISTYKGQHKEEEEVELSPRERRKQNPKAWID